MREEHGPLRLHTKKISKVEDNFLVGRFRRKLTEQKGERRLPGLKAGLRRSKLIVFIVVCCDVSYSKKTTGDCAVKEDGELYF